jgi:hypothetical protein
MANPQQSLDQIKAQIESLKQQLGKTGLDVVNITDLTTAQTLLRGLQDEAADLATSFGDMASILANIVGELSKSDTATKSATKAYKGLVSIAQKMQYEEEGIYAYNVKQLDNLHSQAKAQLTNLQTSIARLTPAEQATAEGQALLKALEDQYAIENDLIKAIEKRLILEKKVEKTFGATGALIEGSSKLLSTMGFGHLSTELSELGDKLKAELRDKLKESGDEANRIGLSFKFMAKGLAGSAKIFADGLTDPLFIVGKIFDTYLEINKASVDLQRLTGQNAVTFENIGANVATLKDTLETMSELTKRTGKNAQNIFSSEVIGQAAALKTTMGLTAEEAGGIAIMSQTSGKAVDDITDSVVATTSAFNGANRSAVSQGQVLRDVANTADSIKLSLGNNDVAIAKAASAARRLGMDLGRVDEIAGSLMNFEDSIGKELEAELLTGKELNLEKARELALNNDLAGLSEELFKNSSDIAEFGKMNRIQQESYAAALGMTKDELAKIAYQKALDLNMTDEQAAKAAGVNAEEMKRVDAQQNFAKALEKIAGALAPILDLVGDLLSIPLAPYFILGFAAVYKLGAGLKGTLTTMGSLARSTKDFFSNFNGKKAIMDFFGGLKDKFGDLKDKFKELKGAFGEGFAKKAQEKATGGVTDTLVDKAQEKAGDAAGGLADKATEAGKKVPEKTGGGMSSLTESIQKIKPTQILAGAAALVLVAGAVYIFAKAAQEFATVSWEDMAKAGVGLLGLVAALAAVGAIMMSGVGALAILAGAAAIVIMAGGLFILGKALQEVGEGMQMMEPALSLVASIGDKAMGLMTVGASLMGIAAGLREIASAGTGAIPVLDKINALAGGGNKSVGGAKGKEEGTMAALEAKFDTLIALVKQGTTINLDGSKIATSVNRNLPRVQTASS